MHEDPALRRIVRVAIVFCLLATLVAWVLAGGAMAAGVVGGGLLIAVSFYTIGSGVAALVAAASQGDGRPKPGRTLAKVVLRYALLGFLAYVMIARLRLHPIGLIVGATSITAAAFVEAARNLTNRS